MSRIDIIVLGSDHAGYTLKQDIKKIVDSLGYCYEDIGDYKPASDDDYPDFVRKVCEHVLSRKNAVGILICGSGTGVCIAANRYRGIRAGVGYDRYSAKMMRHDENANVLCLRSRRFSREDTIKILHTWLREPFTGEARHKRRIRTLDTLG